MRTPTFQIQFAALEQTWPAAREIRQGPWTIRDGLGGGKRASATTTETAFSTQDILHAEAAMHSLEQPLLFMIRPEEEALDMALEAQGYSIIDPVILYTVPVDHLTQSHCRACLRFTFGGVWRLWKIFGPRVALAHKDWRLWIESTPQKPQF